MYSRSGKKVWDDEIKSASLEKAEIIAPPFQLNPHWNKWSSLPMSRNSIIRNKTAIIPQVHKEYLNSKRSSKQGELFIKILIDMYCLYQIYTTGEH